MMCEEKKTPILVVTGAHPYEATGGAELQAHLIARELHSKGVSVVFCTWSSAADAENIEEDGLAHVAIDRRHALPVRALRFYRIARSRGVRVVYVRCLYSCGWIRLVGYLAGYRTIYHISSITHCRPEKLPRRLHPMVWHWFLLRNWRILSAVSANRIICQSREQQALIRSHFSRLATVIYNGYIVPASVPMKQGAPWRVVWIGKHWKHPERFAELARRMAGVPHMTFTMVGTFPGETASPYIALDAEQDSFHFMGPLPYEGVDALLAESHVLVCTSDYEGFSNTFVQAWLQGVPVVSLCVDPDGILERQRIGMRSGTLEQAEKDIHALLEDNGCLLGEYASNAFAYACREHDIQKTAAAVLRVCREGRQMRVLQVMGCTSNQYASMERYLVAKAATLFQQGGVLHVVYEEEPESNTFRVDLEHAGGVLHVDRWRGFKDVAYIRRMRRIVLDAGIDVVHGYFTPTCHGLAMGLRLCGLSRVVRTAANLPCDTPTPSLKQKLRAQILALAQRRIICRSESVAVAFCSLGVSSSKLAVADGGCDIERYRGDSAGREAFRAQQNLRDEKLVIGVACRLVKQKALDRLLRLLPHVVEQVPELCVVIAGEGPERASLQDLILKLGLSGNVRLIGHQDGLTDFYCGLDIYCLPSIAEGMSNSILEAMACERPVIASDIGPNRGLVDGRGGFLCGFEDATELACAVQALSDAELRNSMGAFNRQFVTQRYSLRSRIDRELGAYLSIMPVARERDESCVEL